MFTRARTHAHTQIGVPMDTEFAIADTIEQLRPKLKRALSFQEAEVRCS